MKKCFFLLLIFPVTLFAQKTDSVFIKKISDEVLTNGQAYDLLKYLTNRIGARLAGSENILLAEKWGATSFKNFSADAVFLQPCKVPTWVRGGGDFANINISNSRTPRQLQMLALGNSIGSNQEITAPILVVQNFDELETKKAEVKNKIVYFNQAFNAANVQPFKSYGETVVYRAAAPSRAAKYGAVGVIIRSMSEEPNYAHTGSMKYNDSFPKIPAIAVSNTDANFLWSIRNEKGFTVTMATHGQFRDSSINHNVIAELKGTEFPNQYITIGAHLDSWDVGTGAHDDGAGVVQTIEVLRTLKVLNYKPKHTIRFVLFANEENGLMGGKQYALKAAENKEEHIFAVETDAGGFTPRAFGFSNISAEKLKQFQKWQPLLQPYGIDKMNAGGGGADIGPLQEYFKSIIMAGLQPDAQRYFDHHHSDNDIFFHVNKRELLLGAVNLAALIYLVDKYGL